MSNRVDKMTVLEHYDCAEASAMMLQVMGFGLDPTTFRASPIAAMWDTFFNGTIRDTVSRLGAEVERIDRSYELSLSPTDQIDGLPVPVMAGTVAGSWWTFTAVVDDKPFFELQTQWRIGEPITGWESDSGWTITVEGFPCMQMKVLTVSNLETKNFGDADYNVGTMSALVMNSAAHVVAAPPGLMSAPVFAAYDHGNRAQA